MLPGRPYNLDMTDQHGIARWRPGDQIVVRELLRGKVWAAWPVTLVEDNAKLVAYYLAEGTMWKRPTTINGARPTPRELLPGAEFVLADSRWTGTSLLFLVEPNGNSATFVVWDEPDHVLNHWYINLQTPLERTSVGFDFFDQQLDLVIEPDKNSWYWKDEDELEEAIQLGVLSQQRADELYAEGRSVLQRIQEGTPPFDRDWPSRRPLAEWSIPSLGSAWKAGTDS